MSQSNAANLWSSTPISSSQIRVRLKSRAYNNNPTMLGRSGPYLMYGSIRRQFEWSISRSLVTGVWRFVCTLKGGGGGGSVSHHVYFWWLFHILYWNISFHTVSIHVFTFTVMLWRYPHIFLINNMVRKMTRKFRIFCLFTFYFCKTEHELVFLTRISSEV